MPRISEKEKVIQSEERWQTMLKKLVVKIE